MKKPSARGRAAPPPASPMSYAPPVPMSVNTLPSQDISSVAAEPGNMASRAFSPDKNGSAHFYNPKGKPLNQTLRSEKSRTKTGNRYKNPREFEEAMLAKGIVRLGTKKKNGLFKSKKVGRIAPPSKKPKRSLMSTLMKALGLSKRKVFNIGDPEQIHREDEPDNDDRMLDGFVRESKPYTVAQSDFEGNDLLRLSGEASIDGEEKLVAYQPPPQVPAAPWTKVPSDRKNMISFVGQGSEMTELVKSTNGSSDLMPTMSAPPPSPIFPRLPPKTPQKARKKNSQPATSFQKSATGSGVLLSPMSHSAKKKKFATSNTQLSTFYSSFSEEPSSPAPPKRKKRAKDSPERKKKVSTVHSVSDVGSKNALQSPSQTRRAHRKPPVRDSLSQFETHSNLSRSKNSKNGQDKGIDFGVLASPAMTMKRKDSAMTDISVLSSTKHKKKQDDEELFNILASQSARKGSFGSFAEVSLRKKPSKNSTKKGV